MSEKPNVLRNLLPPRRVVANCYELAMFRNYTETNYTGQSSVESVTEFIDTRKPNARPWDTSDPLFSAHTRETLKIVFTCYVRQLITVVGIPGNIINCVIFWKDGLSDRINLLLFWLAVADLTYLTTLLCYTPRCYFLDDIETHNWGSIMNAKISYINMWSGFVSGTLILVMSVDRCLSVAMPLKARILLTYRSMVAAILASYLVSMCCFLPGFLAFTVKWRVDPVTNRSIAYTVDTSWFPMEGGLAVFFITYVVFVADPVYLVTVVTCCIITIVSLRRASQKRLQMTENVRDKGNAVDNKITKMLLLVCFVYVILITTRISANMTFTFLPEFFLYKRYHNTFIIVFQVFIFTASCTNSSANFITYLVLSSKYRKTLKKLCFCFGRKSN